MMKQTLLVALLAPIALAGCQSTAYTGGAPKLIARNYDSSFGDAAGPKDGQAAVAILPDGCEAWIVDDGFEGYGGDRSDPKSGLPRCTNEIPRGAVIGEWRTSTDLIDILP